MCAGPARTRGGPPTPLGGRGSGALALDQQIHAIDSIAIDHEDLASITRGTERAAHVRAAKDAWASMDLPDGVTRVTRLFGSWWRRLFH